MPEVGGAASPPTASAAASPAAPATPAPSLPAPAARQAPAPQAPNAIGSAAAPQPKTAAPHAASRPEFAEIFANLARRVSGVVVNISTQAGAPSAKPDQKARQQSPGNTLDEVFRDFFGDQGGPTAPTVASLGSGFIIDPSGLIVTNNHVIANADQITVTLADNAAYKAHVVGRDAMTDLAVLKIDPKAPLPAARWGDSGAARVGDWVLAIGNPFGLGGTVTAGIISATARDIHTSPYDDYLQTDASINRGNSGGPMFNLAGEVIGINTAIYSPSGGSIGIGFAIPSAFARPIVEQLSTKGKVERGWIGAHIQPVTDPLAQSVKLDKSQGAMIASIDPDSPAAQAKLEPGDVILGYDGHPIERSRELPRLVAATPPDKEVRLTIWRGGKEFDATLKTAALDSHRAPPAPPKPEKPKPPATVEAFGLKLAKPTPELRTQYKLPESADGALVTEVPPDSAAAAQGLLPGDLVIGIGQRKLTSIEQVPRLLAAAKKGGEKLVLVRIERAGSTRFVALPAG